MHADTLQKLPNYLRKDYYLDVFRFHNPRPEPFGGASAQGAPVDSGGPILIWIIKGWTLVGVASTVSAEESTCHVGNAGIVTDSLLRWIDDTLDENGDRR